MITKRISYGVNTFYYDKFFENILFGIEVRPIRTKIKFAIEIVAQTAQNEIQSKSVLWFWRPKRVDGHTAIYCFPVLCSLYARDVKDS
jgi:hypothetical protein